MYHLSEPQTDGFATNFSADAAASRSSASSKCAEDCSTLKVNAAVERRRNASKERCLMVLRLFETLRHVKSERPVSFSEE